MYKWVKIGEMIVTSQTTVKNSKGKLIATLKDKPTNFSCVWAGIIVAVVAAMLLALAATLGPLAALIIATIAGVLGSFTLGSMLCYFCLKENTMATWQCASKYFDFWQQGFSTHRSNNLYTFRLSTFW